MFKIIFTIFLSIIAIYLIWQIIAEKRRNRKPRIKLTSNRQYAIDIYKNLVKTYGYVPKCSVRPVLASRRVAIAAVKVLPKKKLSSLKSTKKKLKWTK